MSFINESLSVLINVLHLVIIVFVVAVPFSNSNYLLMLHVIVVPFIILHWLLNNNTCCLTLMEKYIREKTTSGGKVNAEDCFSYKLISPIYDFNNNFSNFSLFTYALTFGLWTISVYNLGTKFYNGEIKNVGDLAQI